MWSSWCGMYINYVLRIKNSTKGVATGKWDGGSIPRWSTCTWHCLRTHYTQMDWAFLSSCGQAHRPLPFLLGLPSLSSCLHLGWLILQTSTHTVLHVKPLGIVVYSVSAHCQSMGCNFMFPAWSTTVGFMQSCNPFPNHGHSLPRMQMGFAYTQLFHGIPARIL